MHKLLILFLISTPAMAQRMAQVPIIVNGSMATSSASIGVDVGQASIASVQVVYSGSPSGSMSIQVSNDSVAYGPASNPSANVVNWTSADVATQSITSTGSVLFNPLWPGYRWMRLLYTRSSGTGVMNATLVYKGN